MIPNLSRPNISETRGQHWSALIRKVGERYEKSGLSNYKTSGPEQQKAKTQLSEFAENILEHTENSSGIWLYGPAGTGKDHLLTAMMRIAVVNFGLDVTWTNGTDMFGWFRDAIDNKSSILESDILRSFYSPTIVAISDPLPPWGELTPYQASQLLRIVDHRYRDMKPTWVTANFATPEEAKKRLGAQVVDRLRDGALTIFCNWPSYREAMK